MAAHSSILAWRIPWTEEPGGLQSMWSQSGMTEQLRCTSISIKSLGSINLERTPHFASPLRFVLSFNMHIVIFISMTNNINKMTFCLFVSQNANFLLCFGV